MKRIVEITNTKTIQLENVKVKFQIKLLQYNINNLLYKYNNKFAFPQYINLLKSELTNIIKQSNLNEDKDATELLEKARELYITLNNYSFNESPQNIAIAVDSTLKFILFNFTKNKANTDIYKELEILKELRIVEDICITHQVTPTDRIGNAIKLIDQLKQSITMKL